MSYGFWEWCVLLGCIAFAVYAFVLVGRGGK